MINTQENNNFKIGVRDGIPIGLGYLSVSFAFGIFAVASGLSVWETLLISMLNLTSAGQLAGVPIIAAGGSLFELGLTQLVINLRYSLMSISLSQRLGESVRVRDRFLISFANTDEVFAVSSGREELLGRRYFLGLIIPPYLGWTLGTLLGALAGNILPGVITSALGIAIYAMFVAIVVPVVRRNAKTALAVFSAILLSCLFFYTPVLNKIPSGFVIVICAVSVSALFALICPIDSEGERNE
ncbi:MAG: AzlC family ABC transporter permease [Ruminococcaceae bacterium]|nr:AzlC family ABC transporter permease [Oscillospiraceae bacterium]